jgi:hypothetical protein
LVQDQATTAMMRNRILTWNNLEEICSEANLDPREMAAHLAQSYEVGDFNTIMVIYDDGKPEPKDG